MIEESERILFVMPHLAFGGAERLASHLAAHLRRQHHHPALAIATRYPWMPEPHDNWFERSMETIVRIDTGPTDWTAAMLRYIAELDASILVVMGHSPIYHALPAVRRHCPGLRIVAFQFNEQELTEEHRIYAPWLDLIVVEGVNLVDLLAVSGVDPDSIALIPSAIDRDRFLAGAGAKTGPAGRRLAVGYVGRMDPAKDPLMFVEIAALLRSRPIDFVIAGDGPLEAKVRKSIRRRGLERNIRYLGRVRSDLMPAIYAELDVVVVPSRIDGRPQVVQEAQASGIPVVAADVGSIRDLIDDEDSGLLCPAGSMAGAYAAQIARLMDQPKLRQRIGGAGRQRVQRDAGLTETLELYTAALLGRAAGSSDGFPFTANSP